MANKQFNHGLKVAFGIAAAILLFYAGVTTLSGPFVLATAEKYNVWGIWSALPAVWLGWLFAWIAIKLD